MKILINSKIDRKTLKILKNWLKNNRPDPDVLDLFNEAITSYEAEAYKGAFICSYLAFFRSIKEKILKKSFCKDICEGEWKDIQKRLLNDDIWEKEVFDALNSYKKQIFPITDELRRTCQYWKDRRNDCAHDKNKTISKPLVENFWYFFINNISKFEVNGSIEELLQKVNIHFDYSYTPKGKNCKYLIEEINNIIRYDELADFYNEIFKIIVGRSSFDDFLEFFDKVIEASTQDGIVKVRQFMLSNGDVLMGILHFNPKRILIFSVSPEVIRNIWYSKLFEIAYNDFPIYCEMLRQKLIPVEQINEANNRLICKQGIKGHTPTAEDKQVLKDNNFFTELRNLVFIEGKIGSMVWTNDRADLIILLLEEYEIDIEIVGRISREFSCSNNPWRLRNQLDSLFYNNIEKKLEFLRIAEKNNIEIPKEISALRKDN